MSNIRLVAANTLLPLLNNTGSLSSHLPSAQALVAANDRALLQELCYGTARHFPQLMAIAHQLLDRPMRSRDDDVLCVLLVGLYQLMAMRIPAHAAISESVDAVKSLDKPKHAGLVNAILRRFEREKDTLLESLQSDEAFRFNHPDWFVQKLRANWPTQWEAILTANNQHPPMTLRVNRLKATRDTYLTQLSDEGIDAFATPFSEDGITLATPCDVQILPGFDEGVVSVQDEAAQLAAELVNPQAGERILDACAAPGGKLCHLLEMRPDCTVDALEVDQRRATRIDENLSRLGLNANVIIGDASQTDWHQGELYDRILVDAPCSATGVIRRNPDIKIVRQGEAIHTLATLQHSILTTLWGLLKPGGQLVYATCSVFSQENDKQIARFIKAHPDATAVPIDAAWGEAQTYGRQLFPTTGGHDGFYYAVLTKQTTGSEI
jgi:16S rRNA (cytosine967-C5)-methyltransferase